MIVVLLLISLCPVWDFDGRFVRCAVIRNNDRRCPTRRRILFAGSKAAVAAGAVLYQQTCQPATGERREAIVVPALATGKLPPWWRRQRSVPDGPAMASQALRCQFLLSAYRQDLAHYFLSSEPKW